jgi:hypothetical protein
MEAQRWRSRLDSLIGHLDNPNEACAKWLGKQGFRASNSSRPFAKAQQKVLDFGQPSVYKTARPRKQSGWLISHANVKGLLEEAFWHGQKNVRSPTFDLQCLASAIE